MWIRLRNSLEPWDDRLIGLAAALAALALYLATLLPGLGIGDTAELQRVVPLRKLAHPTGYPLYTLIGWLWAQVPIGEPAWRMNMFSAAAAALAIGALYLAARALGQPRVVAAAAALTLATTAAFWSQATIAEVYGMATLLQALLLLALLRWEAGRWPFWLVGLIFGLGLAHHRLIVLMVPGALLLFALGRRRPTLREIGSALPPALVCCLLYLYVPLHAPPWRDPWDVLWEYLTGSSVSAAWLNIPRLLAEGPARPLDLARRFVLPELTPIGAALALLGAVRLLRRNRAHAALLLSGVVCVFAFCCAYYVPDVQVFLIPLNLIAALLIGEGALLLLELAPFGRKSAGVLLPRSQDARSRSVGALAANPAADVRRHDLAPQLRRWAALLLFALPALLFARNLAPIRADNTAEPEITARAHMAELPSERALLVGDWRYVEGMRYLQEVEGQRPNIEFALVANRQYILDTLSGGRAVYLMDPLADLGLTQQPVGRLWKVSAAPLRAEAAASPEMRWDDGIALAGYTLHRGPYRPGYPVPLTLDWAAQQRPRQHYTLFIHLIGDDGKIWGQSDREPSEATTDRWQPGRHYLDLLDPLLDPAAPPGRYRVLIGWYSFPSLQRLPLAAPAGASADYATLGEIEVVASR